MNSTTKPPQLSRAREWTSAILLAGYAAGILVATMWPAPLDQGYEESIGRVLSVLHRNGVPMWFGYSKLEATANVTMFVPLGFLTALLLSQKLWWLSIVFCSALSALIEVTQGLALSARFATIDDVIANSLGALIGIIGAVVMRSAFYIRDQKVIARALWDYENRRSELHQTGA